MNNFMQKKPCFSQPQITLSTSSNKACTLRDAHKQTSLFQTSTTLYFRWQGAAKCSRETRRTPGLLSRRVDFARSLNSRRKYRLITVCLVSVQLTNTSNGNVTYIMRWICVIQLCYWFIIAHWRRTFSFHRKRIFSFLWKNPLGSTDRATSISAKKELLKMSWGTLRQTYWF